MKAFIKSLCPPLLWNLLRKVAGKHADEAPPLSAEPPAYELLPDGWAEGERKAVGPDWGDPETLEPYLQAWDTFVERTRTHLLLALDPGRKPDDATTEEQNTIMSFGYVLARAAAGREELSLLDWGGGMGQYGLLAKALLPEQRIRYVCKDFPAFADAGRKRFPDAVFVTDDDCLSHRYDLVMASSSLHYSRDWREVFRKLGGAAESFFYLTRTPTITGAESFAYLQRPFGSKTPIRHVAWCLNREEILGEAERQDLRPVREFIFGGNRSFAGAPGPVRNRGFLFARCDSPTEKEVAWATPNNASM